MPNFKDSPHILVEKLSVDLSVEKETLKIKIEIFLESCK